MNIDFIEIQNFRKLKSVRIDFAKETTVFVGANNSGKTSAMVALSLFLLDRNAFNIDDFTLSHWPNINELGKKWEEENFSEEQLLEDLKKWHQWMPALDLWIKVPNDQIYMVANLIPTLDWNGGLLGVRFRFEPKDIQEFYKDYVTARKTAKETLTAAKAARIPLQSQSNSSVNADYSVKLWPNDMGHYLERRLRSNFVIRPYILDPSKIIDTEDGLANPQVIPDSLFPLEDDPIKKLIKIDRIDAHRGFSNVGARYSSEEDGEVSYEKGKLSEQLQKYYTKHIDPSTMPDPADVDALEAIYQAQLQFDEKLRTGFESKFQELEGLGYPGITDPKLEISTKIQPVDGLKHSSALKYVISSHSDEASNGISPRLPEHYNGLGYQNLISMVFRLMSFRDDWMHVGKAGKKAIASNRDEEVNVPPLHLVLIEEPEAHLHVQVQQVFIRKAYAILRNHVKLHDFENLCTQVVISTHSSHIAHECEFSWLRYFRRLPATKSGEVPISSIVNLCSVFGSDDDTSKFVTRYIKATHCDLFFADGAIFVEGAAERMLVPHFISENFKILNQCYISLLEIGGSHAHRFRTLIEKLGLITLIITDIDAVNPALNNSSAIPERSGDLKTDNDTLIKWHPQKELLNDLLNLSSEEKIKIYNKGFSIRCCYQIPQNITFKGTTGEILTNTFEDALLIENLSLFENLEGTGLIKKFKSAVNNSSDIKSLKQVVFESIKDADKAKFALDLLFLKPPDAINVPTYISEGLKWLQEKLVIRQREVMAEDIAAVATVRV